MSASDSIDSRTGDGAPGTVAGALWLRLRRHFWFKCLGTTAFIACFFAAYLVLLKYPAGLVTTVPLTPLDRWIAFEPLALPVYLSLWAYISLPAALMLTRGEVFDYGLRIAVLCLSGLAIFYAWPNAVPPNHIDWDQYPGMAFLKGVDAAGNACPSLHVATAVFAAFWLHWMVPGLGLGSRTRWFNAAWCAAIAWSTMATKQHVAIDVVAGALFGAAVALALRPRFLPAPRWSTTGVPP